MQNNSQSMELLKERICNLEDTLSINKGIIITLSNSHISNTGTSSIINKLTAETIKLNKQLAVLSKNAINTQIEQDKYFEYTRSLINQITSLKEQTLAKEYSIQFLQNSIAKFTKALRKEAVQSRDTWKLIKNLNKQIDDRRSISNVIDENDALRRKLNDANLEIMHLRTYIDSINASNLIDTTPHSEKNECSFNNAKIICHVEGNTTSPPLTYRQNSISFS